MLPHCFAGGSGARRSLRVTAQGPKVHGGMDVQGVEKLGGRRGKP